MRTAKKSNLPCSAPARLTMLYLALIPADEADNPNSEYVIMKAETDENGEDVLCTIEDDDEFERIAEIFDDQL